MEINDTFAVQFLLGILQAEREEEGRVQVLLKIEMM